MDCSGKYAFIEDYATVGMQNNKLKRKFLNGRTASSVEEDIEIGQSIGAEEFMVTVGKTRIPKPPGVRHPVLIPTKCAFTGRKMLSAQK